MKSRGKIMDGWADEQWLDISNSSLQNVMLSRLDLAAQKGCDGVEPDNMDGYINDTGFELTGEHQLGYNKFIANQAHKRGLSVGLKNDLDQAEELEPFFDFSVNEQCHQYKECESLSVFIENDKPVLNAEYAKKYLDEEGREVMCNASKLLGFSSLVLPLNLDGSFRWGCD
jgi:hypothetical protein